MNKVDKANAWSDDAQEKRNRAREYICFIILWMSAFNWWDTQDSSIFSPNSIHPAYDDTMTSLIGHIDL